MFVKWPIMKSVDLDTSCCRDSSNRVTGHWSKAKLFTKDYAGPNYYFDVWCTPHKTFKGRREIIKFLCVSISFEWSENTWYSDALSYFHILSEKDQQTIPSQLFCVKLVFWIQNFKLENFQLKSQVRREQLPTVKQNRQLRRDAKISTTASFCQFQFKALSDEEVKQYSKNPEVLNQFYDILLSSIDVIKLWAEKIPGFSELCKEDQDLLFNCATLELFILRLAYRCATWMIPPPHTHTHTHTHTRYLFWCFDEISTRDRNELNETKQGIAPAEHKSFQNWPNVCFVFLRTQADDERVIFCNSLVLHRLQCLPGFGEWINSIMQFGRSLHRIELDISALACMLALVMVTREYTHTHTHTHTHTQPWLWNVRAWKHAEPAVNEFPQFHLDNRAHTSKNKGHSMSDSRVTWDWVWRVDSCSPQSDTGWKNRSVSKTCSSRSSTLCATTARTTTTRSRSRTSSHASWANCPSCARCAARASSDSSSSRTTRPSSRRPYSTRCS